MSIDRPAARCALGVTAASFLALLGGCGADSELDGGHTAGATGRSAATAPDAASGDRYRSGLQTLDTGHDLSKIGSQAAAARGDATSGSIVVVRDEEPPSGGLVRPGERLKGGLSIAEGGSSFDLGTIRQGESRTHVFELVSDGKEPLIIRTIKPSCGCTKAKVTLVTEDGLIPYDRGDSIPIGQRFELFAEVSTKDKRGNFAATVSLYTNDPTGPFSVRLTAQIEPVLVVEPEPSIFFRQMTTADQVESTFQVFTERGEPILLAAEEQDLRGPVGVELLPVEPDEEGRASRWDVKVVLGPNTPVGMRNYPLRLRSDLPIGDAEDVFHTAMITVQARVTGLVHAEPSFVSFGMVRPGQIVERSVRIECHDDFVLSTEMPITVEGLYGQEFPYADAFTTAIEPVEGGRLVDLKLRLEGLPDDLNGSFGGILKVSVGHPGMDELTVRFSGVCRPGL